MGTTGNQHSATGGAPARPSLLSTGSATQDHNVLDTMGQRQPARQSIARSGRLVWLLLLLLAGTALFLFSRRSHESTPDNAAPQIVAVAPTTSPAPSAPPPTHPEPAAAPATAEQQDTVTPVVSLPAATASDPFSTLDSAVPPRPAPPETAARTSPAATQAEPPVRPQGPPKAHKTTGVATTPKTEIKQVKSTNPRPVAPAEEVVVRKKPATPNEPATAKAGPNVRTAAAGKGDPDVELLSAIMKHLDEGKDKVATNRSAQTIADLVKSCQTRDSIETLLCQRRICEGSWGKAQACPMHLAPRSAKAATTPPAAQ